MGCVFGRAAASSPAMPRKKRGKESPSPQPKAGSPSAVAAAGDGDGRSQPRLGCRRAARPRQGYVPAATVAEQLAAGWPPWLVAVARRPSVAGRRTDTFDKLTPRHG